MRGVTPHSLSKIESALFGNNEAYAEWRHDLRVAYRAARVSKYTAPTSFIADLDSKQTLATVIASSSNFMVPGAMSDEVWLSHLPRFVATASEHERSGKVFQFYELISCIYWRLRHCSLDRIRWLSTNTLLGSSVAELHGMAQSAAENSGLSALLRGDHARFDAETTKRAAKADLKRAYGFEDDECYRMNMARLAFSFSLFGARSPEFRRQLGLDSASDGLIAAAYPLFESDRAMLIQQSIIDYQAHMRCNDIDGARRVLDAVEEAPGEIATVNNLKFYPAHALYADKLKQDFGLMVALGNWSQNKARYYIWLNILGNDGHGTCNRARVMSRARDFYKWTGLQAVHANAHLLTAEGMLDYAEDNARDALDKLEAASSSYILSDDEQRWSTVRSLINEIGAYDAVSEPTMCRFIECAVA